MMLRRTVVVVSLFLAGCSPPELKTVLQEAGFVDPPPPPTIGVTVILDASSSAGSDQHLGAIIDWSAPAVAQRPGSMIRLVVLGDDLGSTRVLASSASTPGPNAALSSVREHEQKFHALVRETFLHAARPFWHARRQASPIAEGLSAAGAFPGGDKQLYVLLSDLRQESALAHFECGILPAPAAWLSRTKHLFGRLRGATVVVAFATPFEPVSGMRCRVTNERFEQVQSLWRSAITASGAQFITYPAAPAQPIQSFLGGAQ